MKKARYAYYCPKGENSFSTGDYTGKRYLMRKDSKGLWTAVYLVKGVEAYNKNVLDSIFDKCAKSGDWEKAPAKLARRAAQLNKK